MPPLDWSQCPAIESIPGKCGGRWLLKNTRMPVQIVFENLASLSMRGIAQECDVDREDLKAVLEFVVRSLDLPVRHGED